MGKPWPGASLAIGMRRSLEDVHHVSRTAALDAGFQPFLCLQEVSPMQEGRKEYDRAVESRRNQKLDRGG